MRAPAMYPATPPGRGIYESFYLRAVSPSEPVGVWIRHTVHKPPAGPARGSVWCTVFDARAGRPFMHKLSEQEVSAPAAGWIAIGDRARMGPAGAQGECGAARWSLRFEALSPELRHLRPELLYRTPLPRTKLTSPAPLASFDGRLQIEGRGEIDLHGWRGMVGHNWGSEHAARWIWLHGVGFTGAGDSWLDVALGRLLIGGRMTPWAASGAVSVDGQRHRLGGLLARGLTVRESIDGCELSLPGAHGVLVRARAEVPAAAASGWIYADPSGSERQVVNCSVAKLALELELPGGGRRTLASEHGAAYELGTSERDNTVAVAPFHDG